VKQCVKYIKKTLVHIYNATGSDASLSSGIFPDRLKIAKVIPLYKRGTLMMLTIIDLYPFYRYFPKY
jgi:hypothetical protein